MSPKGGFTALRELERTNTVVLTTRDEDEWRSALPSARRVTASLEYVRIREEHTGHPARLFVLESDGTRVVKPFYIRTTRDLPFVGKGEQEQWDILSPEYSGPIVVRGAARRIAPEFEQRFTEFCRDGRIVAEFAHLHPFDCASELLEPRGIAFDREIVWVDLTLPSERLFRESFTHACRKNIHRSEREGVRVFRASTNEDVREFHRLYIDTMERNRADRSYFLPLKYFMDFFETMPETATFFLAEYRDRIVAATLYLHDDSDVYSYLGGADPAFQHVRPTNAIIYALIRFASSRGTKRFILGGGYRPNDGIFRFKSSFSPLRARFRVYRRIHSPESYERLSSAWSAHYGRIERSRDFFPVYRTTPAHEGP